MTPAVAAPGLSPSPPSAPERWRSIPLGWRIVLIILAAVAVVELASSTVTGVARGGNGASGPSSSYDSSGSGTEALAQLLTERGHRLDRLTETLGGATLPAGSTIFILDPTSWSASDTEALRRDLAQRDRVVVGGRSPAPGFLRSLLGVSSAPIWLAPPAGSTHPVVDVPEVANVHTVVATGGGTFAPPPPGDGEPVPLLEGPGGVLALVARGRGTTVLLASSSPLHNGSLGQADNAALALDLTPPGSPVVFDEYDHGFGRPGAGLAGLPASWRWGLGFALLAVFVWILSASRRFGPPERRSRMTVPPRVQYVDAMATLLSTRPTDQLVDAVTPVRDEARRRLCRRLGVAVDAPDELLRQRLSIQSGSAGLPAELAEAVLGPVRSDEDVMAVGRALSELEAKDVHR